MFRTYLASRKKIPFSSYLFTCKKLPAVKVETSYYLDRTKADFLLFDLTFLLNIAILN